MKFSAETLMTKKNKKITLRMPQPSEAQSVLDCMVEIAESAPYILSTPDSFRAIKLEDESKWINDLNENPAGILIAVEFEGKISGLCDFRPYKNIKMRHRGALGISLHPFLRGEGIGELLFSKLLREIKSIPELRTIELSLMGDNMRAYSLYQKVGFVETGRRKNAFLQPDGSFQDEIYMERSNV